MDDTTVLLVEDDPDEVVLVRRAFERHRFAGRVDVVGDGAEALDYLFGDATAAAGGVRKLPDVVLLDLGLPKVSGFEVLRRMRADPRTRDLPVVVLTASEEERDRIESLRLGANRFVRKPVDYVEFVGAACQLGLYWLLFRRPAPAPAS